MKEHIENNNLEDLFDDYYKLIDKYKHRMSPAALGYAMTHFTGLMIMHCARDEEAGMDLIRDAIYKSVEHFREQKTQGDIK